MKEIDKSKCNCKLSKQNLDNRNYCTSNGNQLALLKRIINQNIKDNKIKKENITIYYSKHSTM